MPRDPRVFVRYAVHDVVQKLGVIRCDQWRGPSSEMHAGIVIASTTTAHAMSAFSTISTWSSAERTFSPFTSRRARSGYYASENKSPHVRTARHPGTTPS